MLCTLYIALYIMSQRIPLSTSGKTHPNPEMFSELGGARVPHGKGVAQEAAADSTLLYNEYIIYDVAQCNAKYLFRMKFDYKL